MGEEKMRAVIFVLLGLALISGCVREAPEPEIIEVCTGLYGETTMGNETEASSHYLSYENSENSAIYYFYFTEEYSSVMAENFDFERGMECTLDLNRKIIKARRINFTCVGECDRGDFDCLGVCGEEYTAKIEEVNR